ncbi:hypothetical protein GCM10009589_14810 [Arthrobacter pascens]
MIDETDGGTLQEANLLLGGAPGLFPASVSRRDAIMNEIRRGIVAGSMRPGDTLTEAKLSIMLSVRRPDHS